MENGVEPLSYSPDVETSLQDNMYACVQHAINGLSDMVGGTYEVKACESRCASILLLPGFTADPEADAVGVYLRAVGPVCGQLLMSMPLSMAKDMVERMTGSPFDSLGSLEISALGEAGNLMSGHFLRELEENSRFSARPTPPAVVVDMLSTILETVALSSPELAVPKILTHAAFQLQGTSDRADFWFVFDHSDACQAEVE
jgi:chemotaxis protein CheY-P-specific phosphatase CheC